MRKIQSLLRELSNTDWWVRNNVMRTLMHYPENTYLPFLEAALKDHDNADLRNASMDFYRVLDSRALPSLLALIKDDDPEVRLFAANLLGDIKARRAIPELVQALRDPDVNVRVASAEALGKIGDPAPVDALKDALQDEPWVAMAAIKSLGDIGGDRALAVLHDCLEIEEYRGIAFDALENAGNENSIRYLTRFVDRHDMRELALRAIVTIAEREGVRLMPEYFINLVPMLIDLQRSPHGDLKKAAFVALAWSGDLRGLPYFIDALNDEELQEYAIGGIMAIGERAVPDVIDGLKDSSQQQRPVLARILSMLGEYMTLIQFSRDDDPEVRVEVALALAHVPAARAAEILPQLLQDSEDEVSSAAKRTIRILGQAL